METQLVRPIPALRIVCACHRGTAITARVTQVGRVTIVIFVFPTAR